MSRFRRRSVKVYRKLSDGPVLPSWVKVLPFVLGGIAFVLLSTQMFKSPAATMTDKERLDAEMQRIIATLDDPALSDALNPGSTTPPTTTGPTTPGSQPPTETTPPVEQPPTDPQGGAASKVSLQLRSGGAVDVAEDALRVARTATTALFTGRFDGVVLAPGATPPALPRTWADPYVGDPVVDSLTDGVISITFRVDPDRNGAAGVREITTNVEFVPGTGWAWLGV